MPPRRRRRSRQGGPCEGQRDDRPAEKEEECNADEARLGKKLELLQRSGQPRNLPDVIPENEQNRDPAEAVEDVEPRGVRRGRVHAFKCMYQPVDTKAQFVLV